MPSSFLLLRNVSGQPFSLGTAAQPLPLSDTDSTHTVHSHRSSLMCRHDCRTNSLLSQELNRRQIPGLIKPTLVFPVDYSPVSSRGGTFSRVTVTDSWAEDNITSAVREHHSGTASPRCWLGAIMTRSQYSQVHALRSALFLEDQMAPPPGKNNPFKFISNSHDSSGRKSMGRLNYGPNKP